MGSQALLTNMSCSHCGVSHLSSTHWKSHVQGTSQRANLRWQCETQSLPMDIKYELPAAVAQSSPSNIWATGGKLFCQPREDKIHPSWQFSAVKTPKKKKKKECAISCGSKSKILSHKSSVLKIFSCKQTSLI